MKSIRFIHYMFAMALIATVVISGCIPQRQTVFLQDLSERDQNYTNPFDTLEQITGKYYLMPNDYLYVRVNTLDPKISEFFNSSSSLANMGMQSSMTFSSYLIDDNMDIDFPYTGKINLKGCNIPKAKERIGQALQPFLKEMNLTVRLATSTFTVLGEVRSPGSKSMGKDQITIFEAIALAGDFTPYGKRKKVKLLRQTPSGPITYVFDLTDKNIVNSQHYYVYPNDFIYVKPMKAKTLGIGESFTLGIFTSLLATYLAVTTLIK